MRRHNLGLVLTHIARHGPRSRAGVARETGLNKTTVSSLVAQLIAAGLLSEVDGEPTGRVGRPSLDVALDGRALVALGVELNVDHLALVALDLRGTVRHRAVVGQDNGRRSSAELLAAVARLAEQGLRSVTLQDLTPVAVTVAVPGLVDFSRGTVEIAPNLGLAGVPLARRLAAELGHPQLPIYVDNEANLGVVAERADGAARGYDDVVYVSAGFGIGAGIVIGGELYRGGAGFGGELGHVTVTRDGPACGCGARGCLEACAGLGALLRRAGLPADPGGSEPATRLLLERAAGGEEPVLRALEEVGGSVGVGLASLANLVNPRRIVLGGFLGVLSEWLLPAIRAEMAQRVLAAPFVACELVPAQLGEDAPAHGGSRLALQQLLADPGALLDEPGLTAAAVASRRKTTRPA